MKMSNNMHALKMMTMGSAALIVSAGAMAATPTSPVTTLSAHSGGLNYAISQTAGIENPGNYDSNGDLITTGLTCGNGGTITCTELDGTGDGMVQYKVTDTNTGQTHVELVVGQMYDGGLFLSDTFIRYNMGTSYNSMANKMVIKDQTELAAADTGFRVEAEWLRGSYQTFQSSALFNALGNTNGALMDSFVDQNIGGVSTFHAEGQNGPDGSLLDPWNMGNAALIDIQSGTTAANTSANPADAAAMGVFHYRAQGGAALGTYNYNPGVSSIVLGANTLAMNPVLDGVSTTYIHQAAMPGFSSTDNYTSGNPVDDPSLRDFAYVKFTTVDVSGFPPVDIGQPKDPMLGIPQRTASLTGTSQYSTPNVVGGLVFPSNNNVPEAPFNAAHTGVGVNDPGTSINGGFLTSNVSAIQAAWTALFGVTPE